MQNVEQQFTGSSEIGLLFLTTGRRRRYDACVGFAPGSRPRGAALYNQLDNRAPNAQL